jgi:Tfp pilus assembly protein PilX
MNLDSMIRRSAKRASRGYALVTALIFLVLLTLVALAAIRGSGLEAKMSSNSTERTQAFESAELARTLADNLVDANTYYRGWPASIGGSVPTAGYDATTTALFSSSNGFSLTQPPQTTGNWYSVNSECPTTTTCAVFKPTGLDQDASFTKTITTSGNSTPVVITAELSVYKLVVSYASGAGLVMASGYQGFGHGAAGGGGSVFYYVSSSGHESATKDATAQTASVYREVIRN